MFKLFSPSSNKDLLRFVGFFTAHMVWKTESGTVTPLVAFEVNGKRNSEQFSAERYEEATQKAQKRYQQLVNQKTRCVLIYDGFITLGNDKVQALIIDGSHNKYRIKLALPYKSPKDEGGPKIYKPKVIALQNIDMKDFGEFFEGVYSHEKAWAYWKANIDETK